MRWHCRDAAAVDNLCAASDARAVIVPDVPRHVPHHWRQLLHCQYVHCWPLQRFAPCMQRNRAMLVHVRVTI
jgi:hypothetical protein